MARRGPGTASVSSVSGGRGPGPQACGGLVQEPLRPGLGVPLRGNPYRGGELPQETPQPRPPGFPGLPGVAWPAGHGHTEPELFNNKPEVSEAFEAPGQSWVKLAVWEHPGSAEGPCGLCHGPTLGPTAPGVPVASAGVPELPDLHPVPRLAGPLLRLVCRRGTVSAWGGSGTRPASGILVGHGLGRGTHCTVLGEQDPTLG